MDTSIYNKPDKELLEWELSLSSSDLRSHAWYHGNIPRNLAELLLEEDGEFLVRDSSTYVRSGDLVLSTKWNGSILHFLIHKEVLQPDTIYEQLGYRFENESFTTVQDLITYYVGNREPISVKSGAIISLPRTRTVPVSRKDRIHAFPEPTDMNEYVTLAQEAARHVLPVEALLIEKSFITEGLYQVSLNLKPPPGLLESLEEIPDRIKNLDEYKKRKAISNDSTCPFASNFDLSTFSSILLPTKLEDIPMNPELIRQINSRILEASDRAMAFHLTKVDWELLTQKLQDDSEVSDEESCPQNDKRIYESLLNDRQFRWNYTIERAFTIFHFVAVTILEAEVREEMLHKWIGIANELKTAMGNFFSYCSIMRGLTCSKINAVHGPIDWLKLRRAYTNAAFLFETSLRNSYHNLLQGIESYPPNTTIPDILPSALILEESSELFPLLKNSPEQDKLRLTVAHLRQFYIFCDNESMYSRNWQRLVEDSIIVQDIILTDICQPETQLLTLWGVKYNSNTLLQRCKHFDNTF